MTDNLNDVDVKDDFSIRDEKYVQEPSYNSDDELERLMQTSVPSYFMKDWLVRLLVVGVAAGLGVFLYTRYPFRWLI